MPLHTHARFSLEHLSITSPGKRHQRSHAVACSRPSRCIISAGSGPAAPSAAGPVAAAADRSSRKAPAPVTAASYGWRRHETAVASAVWPLTWPYDRERGDSRLVQRRGGGPGPYISSRDVEDIGRPSGSTGFVMEAPPVGNGPLLPGFSESLKG